MIVKKIEFDKFKISSKLTDFVLYKALKGMYCPSMGMNFSYANVIISLKNIVPLDIESGQGLEII